MESMEVVPKTGGTDARGEGTENEPHDLGGSRGRQGQQRPQWRPSSAPAKEDLEKPWGGGLGEKPARVRKHPGTILPTGQLRHRPYEWVLWVQDGHSLPALRHRAQSPKSQRSTLSQERMKVSGLPIRAFISSWHLFRTAYPLDSLSHSSPGPAVYKEKKYARSSKWITRLLLAWEMFTRMTPAFQLLKPLSQLGALHTLKGNREIVPSESSWFKRSERKLNLVTFSVDVHLYLYPCLL